MFKEKMILVAKLLRNALFSVMLFLFMGMLTFGSLATGFIMAFYQLFTKQTYHKDDTIIDVKADSVWFEKTEQEAES